MTMIPRHPKIKIKLSKTLQKVLLKNNIDPFTGYKTAYNGTSVGLDLYNASDKEFRIKGVSCVENMLDSKDKVLIPTGVFTSLPCGYGAFIEERGSIVKTPLVKRAGVIDPDYTGEIFVNLACILHGQEYTIRPGEKLPVQLVIKEVITDYTVVSDEEYEKLTQDAIRKSGMIGSSDKK